MEKNTDTSDKKTEIVSESGKPDWQTALETTSDGLLFMSETDAPFQLITATKADEKATAKDFVKQQFNVPSDAPVKMVTLDKFFKNATADQDWYEAEEKANAKKFQALQKTIEEKLTDVQVVRVGKTEIAVYIVGKTPDGDWLAYRPKWLKPDTLMIVVFTFLHVRGIALFPFIFIQSEKDRNNRVLLNHEKIHHRQQVEMLLVFFYLAYLSEYAVYRLRGMAHFEAYMNLSFEKEAYTNDEDLRYLKKRKFGLFSGIFEKSPFCYLKAVFLPVRKSVSFV